MQLLSLSRFFHGILLAGACCLLVNCKEKITAISPQQLVAVKDSVKIMTEQIAKNVSQNGPIEWLKVFDNSPDFFMADDGQIAFINYDSASSFINHVLVKSVRSIQLRWSSVRIEPLTQSVANLAANYQENVTDTTGKTTSYIGYFTGLAKQTSQGWKLHNAHWSSLPVSK